MVSDIIVVVGASQAGLLCASELANGGARVYVFDQVASPSRIAQRTLIVTPEFRRFIELPGDIEVLNEISGFRIWVGQRSVNVDIAEPDLIVDRKDIILNLVGKAEAAGAHIRWAQQLVSVASEPEGLALLFLDRSRGRFYKVTTRILIAADGATSRVAESLNCNGKLRVPILQARVSTRHEIDPYVVDTWFEPGRTPYFYWQIPDSKHTAAIGFVARDTASGNREFARLLSDRDFTVERVEAALVPLYSPFERPYRRYGQAELYLVGDAAGQVKVTTVGGTVTGLAGAKAAARAILNKRSYVSELRQVRRELNVHYLIRLVMDQFSLADYHRLVTGLGPGVLSVLRSTNRDRFASVFRRVLVMQPGLIALGAKGLARFLANRLRRK